MSTSVSRTFAMIKPDATARGVEGDMLADIQAAGFRLVEMRRTRLTTEQAEWLYREHAAREHFTPLVQYTVSDDVVLLLLERDGEKAALDFRSLMGPTDSTKAPANTLRARYAVGYRENSIHGSDGAEAASEEIPYFFGADRMVGSEGRAAVA